MMLRDRYLEVRYEDICLDFDHAAGRVLSFIGAPNPTRAMAQVRPRVRTDRVHTYLSQPRRKVRNVVALIKPLLLALGYLEDDL
jgi:hypothetical protein